MTSAHGGGEHRLRGAGDRLQAGPCQHPSDSALHEAGERGHPGANPSPEKSVPCGTTARPVARTPGLRKETHARCMAGSRPGSAPGLRRPPAALQRGGTAALRPRLSRKCRARPGCGSCWCPDLASPPTRPQRAGDMAAQAGSLGQGGGSTELPEPHPPPTGRHSAASPTGHVRSPPASAPLPWMCSAPSLLARARPPSSARHIHGSGLSPPRCALSAPPLHLPTSREASLTAPGTAAS